MSTTAVTTGRIHGSDVWHDVQVSPDDRIVKLLCSGRTTRRGRVLVDPEGVNSTCLLCQRNHPYDHA